MGLHLGLGLTGQRVGFNPASLFTVAGSRGFTFDLSDYSTQWQDTGATVPITTTAQSVARVNDLSGLGNHAVQPTAGSRPLTTTIGASIRGLQFDGVDDWLQTAAIDFSNSDEVTVVAGVRKLSDAGGTGIIAELGPASFSTDGSFVVFASNDGPNYGFITRGTLATASQTLGTFTAPISNVVSVRYDNSGSGTGASAQNRPRVNGIDLAAVSGTTAGNYRNDIFYIGRRNGSVFPFNGVITFLFAINRLLTANELASVEAYANARTGAY